MSLGILFSGNPLKQETMATKKTAKAPKGQVKLREKKLKDGSSSLYLDINVGGKRHKEYLKLYLVVPTTAHDKEVNRQTLAAANAMRARRELEIINGKFDISQPKQEGVRFLEYYRKMCEECLKTPDSKGNWGNWHSCLKHLEVYCDEATTFGDIDAEWIQGFKDYLNTAEKDAQKKKDPKSPMCSKVYHRTQKSHILISYAHVSIRRLRSISSRRIQFEELKALRQKKLNVNI